MTGAARRGTWATATIVVLASAIVAATGPSAVDVIATLKAGNATFVAHPEQALPIAAADRAASQTRAPQAAILSCSDASVPPEVIFHAGLGDLYVVRSAAGVADRSGLAALELAAARLHVPLIVVMGHESCDVVKTALDGAATPPAGANLQLLLKAIKPTASVGTDAMRLRAAILQHVEDTVNDLLTESTTLHDLAASGDLALVGAYYEASTGRVYFSEPAGVSLQARAGGSR